MFDREVLRAQLIVRELLGAKVSRGVQWQSTESTQTNQPSVLTLESAADVPDDTYHAFEADKADTSTRVITAGTRGPVNPMPKRRAAAQARTPLQKVSDAVKKMSVEDRIYGTLAALVVVFVVVLAGGVMAGDSYDIDRGSPEFQAGYSQGKQFAQNQAQWVYENMSQTPDTLYQHCDNVEGAGVDQGIVLYDPNNDTCYFGTQIPAHLAEVDARTKLEQKQLHEALYALGQLAADLGVKADDSWRALAETFAATSKLPMAVEAGRQAFVEHGGDEDSFSPHVAKGGTPSYNVPQPAPGAPTPLPSYNTGG